MSTKTTKAPDNETHEFDHQALERGDHVGIFNQLSTSIQEDFHAALTELNADNELEIWDKLYEHIADFHQAVRVALSQNFGKGDAAMYNALRCSSMESDAYALILIEKQLRDEFEPTKDASVLSNLICNDREFRLVYAIWRWCQQVALHEPAGFSDIIEEYTEIRQIRRIKSGTLQAMKFGHKNLNVDVDGQSVAEDAKLIDKLYRVLFSLIRCGKTVEAVELTKSVGLPVLAAPVTMYQFLFDPSKSPTDIMDENYSLPKKREMFLEAAKRFVEKSPASVPEKMIYAAISGRLEPLLGMASRPGDRLWCYANAAIHYRLQDACHKLKMDEVPLTAESIFTEVTTLEKSPFFIIYGRLLCESWPEVVEWITEFVNNQLDVEAHLDEQMIRFLTAITTVVRIKYLPEDEVITTEAAPLYELLIAKLCQQHLFHLVPFYASFLPEDSANRLLVDIMQDIHDDDHRSAYLKALLESGFNRDKLALTSAQLDNKADPEQNISKFRWLLLNDDRSLLESVIQANTLIRHFLMMDGGEDHAKKVLQLMEDYKGIPKIEAMKDDDSVPPTFSSHLSEYSAHELFFYAHMSCNRFIECCLQLQAFNNQDSQFSQRTVRAGDLTLATEMVVEQRQREAERKRKQTTVDIHRQKTLEAFQKFLRHNGWRQEEKVPADADRVSQLNEVRERYVYELLLTFIAGCNCIEDHRTVLDVAIMIADKKIVDYPLLPKPKLRELLLKIHSYTGHLLS